MPIVGVALIGAGRFGRRHAQALTGLPEARRILVCDRREERAREVASQFGFAGWSTDCAQVAAEPEVQAAVVATEESAHREPACALLRAGKHVLVEKPIATDLQDADAMLRAARRARRLLFVGHLLHFEPAYALLRERLQRGELGRPVSIATRRHCRKSSFQYYDRTHPLVHLGVHDLDLMLWLLGEPLTVKRAWERNTLGRANPEVAWAALESASGVLCQLEVSWLLPGNAPTGIAAELEVIGTEGTARVRSPAPTLTLWTERGASTPDTRLWPDLAGATAGALQDELRRFLRLASGSGAGGTAGEEAFDLSDAERARSALALALEAIQHARSEAKETDR